MPQRDLRQLLVQSRDSPHWDEVASRCLTCGNCTMVGETCRNPFRSIVVRAVGVVYAVEEALRIIETYQRPTQPFNDVPARAGIGHGVSEAPRGLLYHRYEIDADGLIRTAQIVPPTSQNQGAIEKDLSRLIAANTGLGDEALTASHRRSLCRCPAHDEFARPGRPRGRRRGHRGSGEPDLAGEG